MTFELRLRHCCYAVSVDVVFVVFCGVFNSVDFVVLAYVVGLFCFMVFGLLFCLLGCFLCLLCVFVTRLLSAIANLGIRFGLAMVCCFVAWMM